MKKADMVYSLSVDDIQTVAEDELDRKLSKSEVKQVADAVGDYIDWHQAIVFAIERAGIKPVG